MLSTVRVIMSLEAICSFPPRFTLSACSFFTADSASGVAAFPIPRRFAPMQADISSFPSPLSYASGKNIFKMGDIILERSLIIPASRSTCIIPHQRHIIPQRDIVSVIALSAPSNTAPPSSVKLPENAPYTIEIMQRLPNTFPSIHKFSLYDTIRHNISY